MLTFRMCQLFVLKYTLKYAFPSLSIVELTIFLQIGLKNDYLLGKNDYSESEGNTYFKVYFNTYNWHILKVSMILYYHVIVCILYIIGTEYILETILLVILVWLYD